MPNAVLKQSKQAYLQFEREGMEPAQRDKPIDGQQQAAAGKRKRAKSARADNVRTDQLIHVPTPHQVGPEAAATVPPAQKGLTCKGETLAAVKVCRWCVLGEAYTTLQLSPGSFIHCLFR